MKIPAEAQKVFSWIVFDIYQWEQELFDGNFATFEMAKRKGTALVIPVLENGNILVTQQKQPRLGEYIDFFWWRQDEGETFLETAKREFLEESGYEAAEWEHFYEEDLGSSKLNWETHYYLARGLIKISEPEPWAWEEIQILELSLADFLECKFPEGGEVFYGMREFIEKLKGDEELLKKLRV